MLTSEIIERLDSLYKNIKDWNILYLSIKDQNMEKLTGLEDCIDCLTIHNLIIEGAAFLPDWLKVLAQEVDNNEWFIASQKQEQLAKIKECAIILAMDRPEPMAGFLNEYRGKIIEQAINFSQLSAATRECDLFKMLTGSRVH